MPNVIPMGADQDERPRSADTDLDGIDPQGFHSIMIEFHRLLYVGHRLDEGGHPTPIDPATLIAALVGPTLLDSHPAKYPAVFKRKGDMDLVTDAVRTMLASLETAQ